MLYMRVDLYGRPQDFGCFFFGGFDHPDVYIPAMDIRGYLFTKGYTPVTFMSDVGVTEYDGLVIHCDSSDIVYRSDGKVSRIGSKDFAYRADGKLDRIGSDKFEYGQWSAFPTRIGGMTRLNITKQCDQQIRNGRLTWINGISLSYDSRNRLSDISGHSVTYFSDGRIQMIDGSFVSYGSDGRICRL